MPTENERVVEHLDALNKQIAKQNSFGRMFVVGIFYGIGFIVGSAIIATIALGVVAPLILRIPGVREAFITGFSFLQQ